MNHGKVFARSLHMVKLYRDSYVPTEVGDLAGLGERS